MCSWHSWQHHTQWQQSLTANHSVMASMSFLQRTQSYMEEGSMYSCWMVVVLTVALLLQASKLHANHQVRAARQAAAATLPADPADCNLPFCLLTRCCRGSACQLTC